MTKVKHLILLLTVTLLILVFPNMVNAATEYTYSDTEQGIEWTYELDGLENVVNLKCKTTTVSGDVTIPSTIDGKTVISLKGSVTNGAFRDCTGLTGITIPETITIIGDGAFYGCTSLTTVTIPNSVTRIGESAFKGCSGLTTITLSEKLSVIGEYAFDGCSGLTKLIIPNSVTTIEEGAFQYCSGLKELTLSDKLTKINSRTFRECKGLTSIILPNSVTTIDGGGAYTYSGPFANCTKLEKILIPDTVASIGEYAFAECSKLTIYGNDGMTSKEYAEENNIPFKYISEWDNTNIGDDVTAPILESLRIEHSSNFKFDSGTEYFMASVGTAISIKATYTEAIYGNTAPTLIIKCGNGEEIQLSNGVITGQYIVYTYTITDKDVGIISAVRFTGGDIKDEAGNAVTDNTCPALKTTNWGEYFVYANGTTSNSGQGSGSDEGEGSGNGSNDGTGSETNGTGSDTGTDTGAGNQEQPKEDAKDNTTATQKIPAAGLKLTIVFAMLATITACAVIYSRYKKMSDI